MLFPNSHTLVKGLVFFLLLSAPIAANTIQETSPKLEIEGEFIEIDYDSQTILATKNTVIEFKNSLIRSEEIQYDYGNQAFNIPEEYYIKAGKNFIKGTQFRYDFESYKGWSGPFLARINRYVIKGEGIEFKSDDVIIKHASLTTCDLEDPHYKIIAKQIHIYPKWGVLIALDNRIDLPLLPFDLWFPTYIYGSPKYSLLAQYTPIPEFGSTKREGWFVKQSIPYFMNGHSSGKVDLGYMSELGVLLGVSHEFLHDNNTQTKYALRSFGTDGFGGGFTYTIKTTKEQPNEALSNSIDALLAGFDAEKPNKTEMRLELDYGQLINDSRVDYAPYATAFLEDITWSPSRKKVFKVDTDFGVGQLTEHPLDGPVVQDWRAHSNIKFYNKVQLKPGIYFLPSLNISNHIHLDKGDWHRLFIGTAFQWTNIAFKPELSYIANIFNEGESPYEFIQNYAQQDDELGLKLNQKFLFSEVWVDVAYDLERQRYRQLDYTLAIPLHKVTLLFTIKTVQEAIVIGGTL